MKQFFFFLCIVWCAPASFGQKIAVGAIRWDAWIGDFGEGLPDAQGVGLQVEKALGPHEYHYRAPFYSKETGYNSIQCRGNTQAIMDREIQYAKDAGIDYWAFCWYPFHSGLDTARTLYLASKHSHDVKWCIILGTNPFTSEKDAPWLVNFFKKDNYQKVAGGRPLVYIFRKTELKTLDRLRDLCKAEGILPPYVAIMDFTPADAKATAESLRADALSSYKSAVGRNGEPYYPVIPRGDSTNWERYKSTGMSLIPWVTTGRNTKPRIDHPVKWANVPADQWVADGTPGQIAGDLAAALKWVDGNKPACPANVIILYAWNEFDEGGWICPTFGNNTARLDALQQLLKNR